MRLSVILFLNVTLLCLSNTAVLADEDERWFQIELLIFENIDTDSESKDNNHEIWPDNPGSADYNNSIELIPAQNIQTDPSTITDDTGIDVLALEQSFDIAPNTNDGATATSMNGTITTIDLLPTTDSTSASIMNTEQPPQQAEIIPFQLLPDDELQLTEIKIKQLNTNAYRPLLHIGWREPVLSRENAKAIMINKKILSAKEILNQSIPDLNLDSLAQPPSFNNVNIRSSPSPLMQSNQDNDEELTSHDEKIEGTVKVTLGRYLHLTLDLTFQKRAEERNVFSFFDFNKEVSASSFRLTQKRRLRSKELHYFDHPKFGVLAIITPYELPAPEKKSEQNSEQNPKQNMGQNSNQNLN